MNIILLSGGSGKRLWPLSNDIRSKQFIKIFQKKDGTYESMVQRIYRQIKETDETAKVTIATSRAQISAIHNQLGEGVHISPEPCRRDTFPAMALSAAHLTDIQGISEQAGKGEANLVLLGIAPAYPSEKYGYIIPEKEEKLSFVKTFREKPTAQKAKEYIEQGALWNGGVFGCKLKYLLEKAHELMDFTDYQDLYDKYDTMEKISFDYAVVEKEPKIQVMRYAGQWKDIGTWNTMTEAMEETVVGKGIMDETCKDVHIVNELDVPILAMGLQDVVISASPEGILVADKEQSSYMKPFVDQMDGQVKFAEKSWGSYRVIDVESDSMTIKVTLHAGNSMNYHSHRHRDEIWTVIEGEGRTIVDGMEQKVKAGDVITMSAGCRHTVIAETKLKLIEVQIGEEISVQDKEKHELE